MQVKHDNDTLHKNGRKKSIKWHIYRLNLIEAVPIGKQIHFIQHEINLYYTATSFPQTSAGLAVKTIPVLGLSKAGAGIMLAWGGNSTPHIMDTQW